MIKTEHNIGVQLPTTEFPLQKQVVTLKPVLSVHVVPPLYHILMHAYNLSICTQMMCKTSILHMHVLHRSANSLPHRIN